MSVATLTQAQQKFVWSYVCRRMADDKDPNEVIRDDYGGDWSRYLAVMVEWHGIKFCSVCGKANKEDPNFQVGGGAGGEHLCGTCAAKD
ncbi:MAG: hypothetical protein FJ044_05915 [Candidatus Cloacimonetes bacterium]|nr:hypothetical protein [Candidatus Cloacimonadota bacterium]